VTSLVSDSFFLYLDCDRVMSIPHFIATRSSLYTVFPIRDDLVDDRCPKMTFTISMLRLTPRGLKSVIVLRARLLSRAMSCPDKKPRLQLSLVGLG
jgi:hypothetical protein